MKIVKKAKKYGLTYKLNQFPWSLKKMFRLQKRKWARTKFSSRYLTKTSKRVIRSKSFKTYRQKTKKLFKQFFAPHLNERQFKKLFRSNLRYKSTFKRALDLEYRLDTIVYRIFMVSSIGLARELILNKFINLNLSVCILPGKITAIGDLIEPSNKISWQYLYKNMVETNASLKKYLDRVFYKFSFPFVLKKHKRRSIEIGKFKNKKIKTFLTGSFIKLRRRFFFKKYIRLRSNTKSSQKPRKVYLFKNKNKEQNRRNLNFVRTINPSKNNYFIDRRFPASEFSKTLFKSKKNLKFKKFKKKVNLVLKQRIYKLNFFQKSELFLNDYWREIKEARYQERSKIKSKKAKRDIKIKSKKTKRFFAKKLIIMKKRRYRKSKRIKAKIKTKKIYKIFKLKLEALKFANRKKKYSPFLKKKRKPRSFFFIKKICKKNLKKLRKFSSGLSFFLREKTPKVKLKFLNQPHRSKNYTQKVFFFSKRKNEKGKKKYLKKIRRFGIHSRFSFQRYRLNKKIGIKFKYLKKFNNNYKNFSEYKKQSFKNWKILTRNYYYKTSFLLDKKKKRFLSKTNYIGIVNLPNKFQTFLKKTNIKKNKPRFQKGVTRFKRKYLLIRGCYRKYKEFKVEVLLSKKTNYKPVQIRYKEIDLIFKHRPLFYYFVEMNLNTLKSVIMSDVDLYSFPYKSLLDFKTMSHYYKF